MKELKQNLYFDIARPNAIPFVSSYYEKNWGFCLKYNQFKKLKKNLKYKVEINSSIKNGYMISGEALFKGKSKKKYYSQVTYVTHPWPTMKSRVL